MIYVPPSEHILVSDIKKFCEGCGHVRHVDPADVREWFDKSADLEPYVLVTSLSDFSLRLQAEHHPNSDLYKRALRYKWDEVQKDRENYVQVNIGPAANPEKCSASDRYVMKVDSSAACTFNDVPDNVIHWFCTNLDVKHPRITWIPFGLNDDGPGASYLPEYMSRPKSHLCYANFQNNTLERVRLNQWASETDWLAWDKPASLPVRDFFDRMSRCKFVLCPIGNGLDCYRTYEALYLGCVPILEESVFARYLYEAGLPVAICKSFYSLNPNELVAAYGRIECVAYQSKAVTKSYLLNLIAGAA